MTLSCDECQRAYIKTLTNDGAELTLRRYALGEGWTMTQEVELGQEPYRTRYFCPECALKRKEPLK